MSDLTKDTWKSLNSKKRYSDDEGNNRNIITSEFRALHMPYVDPLTLNFKLMLDFSHKSGLLADESNVDSALAYLKRIGQNDRYEMLKVWIDKLKLFVKNYDFLILNVEGLDNVTNKKPGDAFGIEDKLKFTIRETSDMRFQSLITIYRMIWFDNIRNVEVIPANLRRFNGSVLVYGGGYYNMMLYDQSTADKNEPSTTPRDVYPTILKLSDDFFVENARPTSYGFNHHLVSFIDLQINTEDSGREFFTSPTNDVGGDMVKTSIVFNYRFASYSGMFNNIFGTIDFVSVLATAAALDKVSNQNEAHKLKKLPGSAGPFASVEETGFKAIFADVKSHLKNNNSKARFSENGYLGAALGTITSKSALTNIGKQMVSSALTKIEDKYIYSNITKLHNLINDNFSANFNMMYGKYFDTSYAEDTVKFKPNMPFNLAKPLNKVKVEKGGIYTNRGGF